MIEYLPGAVISGIAFSLVVVTTAVARATHRAIDEPGPEETTGGVRDDKETTEWLEQLAASFQPPSSDVPAAPRRARRGTDAWWEQEFALARQRDADRSAAMWERIDRKLGPEFAALVAEQVPIVEAEQARIEREFWAMVNSITAELPVLDLPVVDGWQRAGVVLG